MQSSVVPPPRLLYTCRWTDNDEAWLRAHDPHYWRVRRHLYAALDRLPEPIGGSDARDLTVAAVMAASDAELPGLVREPALGGGRSADQAVTRPGHALHASPNMMTSSPLHLPPADRRTRVCPGRRS